MHTKLASRLLVHNRTYIRCLSTTRLVYLTWNKIDFQGVNGPKGGTSAYLTTSYTRRLYSDVVSLYTMSIPAFSRSEAPAEVSVCQRQMQLGVQLDGKTAVLLNGQTVRLWWSVSGSNR